MLDLGGGGVSLLLLEGWTGFEGEKVGVGGGESIHVSAVQNQTHHSKRKK